MGRTMRALVVEVETRKGAWCHEASTRFPELRIRILNHFPIGGGRSLEMVSLDGEETGEALRLIPDCDGVDDVEILERDEHGARIKLTLRGCALPRAVANSGVLPSMPYDLRCGTHRWLVLGQGDKVNEFVSSFTREGIPVRVLMAGEYNDGGTLTRRQRVVLERAVETGYYDFPRRMNLSRLADSLGISKATLCETLMSIESRVMLRMVDQEAGS